jgi:hypothetical protein
LGAENDKMLIDAALGKDIDILDFPLTDNDNEAAYYELVKNSDESLVNVFQENTQLKLIVIFRF